MPEVKALSDTKGSDTTKAFELSTNLPPLKKGGRGGFNRRDSQFDEMGARKIRSEIQQRGYTFALPYCCKKFVDKTL